MKTPRFFSIVGAQRCGTTWLYSMLDQHPQISMVKPIRPEPKFFLDQENIAKGRKLYIEKYFDNDDDNLVGEKSTSYLEFSDAGKGIKSFFPDAKILIMLRNPIDRAISNYFFSVKNGLETRSIEDVFIKKTPPPQFSGAVSVNPFDYLSRGEYAPYIDEYRKIFSPENIHIAINERVTSDRAELAAVYNFLDVDENYKAVDFDLIVNTSYKDKVVSEDVRAEIQHYYKNDVARLSCYADIDCWGLDV